jgi:transcriptional regulator with XRE-family HTH domain
VIAVEVWTGHTALLLRTALRQSQRRFAERLGVSESAVVKWERQRDRITPRPEFQQILDTALARAPDDAKKRFSALLQAKPESSVSPGEIADSTRAGDTSPALGVLPAAHIASDAEIVSFYERLIVDYAAFDNAAGPTHVVDAVSQHAVSLQNQLRTALAPVRPALARMAARYAEFAGWLYQDCGDAVCGARWTETALSLAHASGENEFVAYVLMRRSNQAVEQHDAGLALGLADAALNAGRTPTARIRALGFRQKAAGLALAHDVHGTNDALTTARDHIAADPEWNPLTGYCTLHYLDAEAAICRLRLGQAEAALDLLLPAIESWPASYNRDRGFYQAHLAEALIQQGHIDDGMAHARNAASVARHTCSGRTVAQLRRLPAILDVRGTADLAAELRDELGTLPVPTAKVADTLPS